MSLIEIKVPDIGDFKEVEVIEILVKVGDTVKAEQSLITVESDKASMEIPSSHAGVVKELKIKLGDKVAEGSIVLMLEASASANTSAPAPTVASTPATSSVTTPAPTSVAAAPEVKPAPVSLPASVDVPVQHGKSHASPSIRKFARELGVDLAQVQGSGPKGRVVLEDVQGFVKGVMRSGVSASPVTSGVSGGMSLLPWP